VINTNGVAVPNVIIQFSFSNQAIVPDETSVIHLEQEIPYVSHARHNLGTDRRGVQIIAPTGQGDTSIADFVKELQEAGYILVNAQSQKRYDYEKSHEVRDYWFYTVRYHFVYSNSAYVFPQWEKLQASAQASLGHIADTSLWRIRVYSNPVFTNTGEENPKQRQLSINAEVRQPLLNQGKPIMVYPRDTDGKKTGAPAVPLQPRYKLGIVDNQVQRMANL